MEELRRRVEAAEQKFKAAELDDRLKEFEAARRRQVILQLIHCTTKKSLQNIIEFKAQRVHQYTEEVKAIKLELSSLREIERSLPRECWNTIRLEP